VSKQLRAHQAAEIGKLRDLIVAQDAALGIRNLILLEVDLTDDQRRRISDADAPYCLLDRPDVEAVA
jgi:hypothetical protein